VPKLYDAASAAFAEVEIRQALGGIDLIGIPTGFSDLDYALSGFRRDNMYTIASSSGGGKTALATSMSFAAARSGAHTVYTSLEMSASSMAIRIISGMTGIHALALEHGRLTKEQLDVVRTAVESLKDIHFTILDGSYTSEELIELGHKYKNKHGLDLFVCDYASLLRDAGSSLYEKETNISLNMREMARRLDIPVVTLVQLNRNRVGRENPRPVPSDIKQTSGYEQDSSAVIFIYRPYIQKMLEEGLQPVDVEEDAELIISKNRHGPPGSIQVNFYPKQMRWADKQSNIVNPPQLQERKKKHANP
jgi:replicative DNA helicase